MAQKRLIAGLFWSLGLCTKGIDASPHTNYLQIFKEHPAPLRARVVRALLRGFLTLRRCRVLRLPSEGGRIIAMSCNPSTFVFSLICCPFRVRLGLHGARSIALIPSLSTHCHFSFLAVRRL